MDTFFLDGGAVSDPSCRVAAQQAADILRVIDPHTYVSVRAQWDTPKPDCLDAILYGITKAPADWPDRQYLWDYQEVGDWLAEYDAALVGCGA